MLPLPEGLVKQHICQALSYTYSFCEREGGNVIGPVQTETRFLGMLTESGTIVTGVGFLPKLSRQLLPQLQCRPWFQDVTPPLPRPNCYETDWATVKRTFEFRPRQEECLQAIASCQNGVGGVIDACTGFGKAQPVDAPVLTPTGWRKIGSLAVGDEVIGSDGKPTQVVGVFPQGRKAVVEMQFSDRTRVLCCKEHLWNVQTAGMRHRGEGFKTLTAEQIAEDLGYASGGSKWFVPLVKPVQFAGTGERPLDPYLLGELLGDGGVMHGTRYPVRDALRQLGLCGKRSEEKWIPESYLYAPIADRIAMLQGLMDTAGTIPADNCRYAEFGPVASQQLAEDVCELVRSLGGTTRVQVSNRAVGTFFRVRVNLGENLFRLPRKAALWKASKSQGRTKAIRDVVPAGEAECVCIKVANADCLYVKEGYTLTHNTTLFQMIALLYPHAKIAITVAGADIVPQIQRSLLRHMSSVGMVTGKYNFKRRVTIYTADSLHKCDNDIDIFIGDEAHELVTEGRAAKMSHLRHARTFFFSGSVDDRMDGLQARLEPMSGPVIFHLPYQEGVRLGLVVPMRVLWLPIDCENPAAGLGGIRRNRAGLWRNQMRNGAIARFIYDEVPATEQVLVSVNTLEHAIFLKQLLPDFTLAYAGADLRKINKYKSWGMLPDDWQPLEPEQRGRLRDDFSDGRLRRAIATSVWSRGVNFDRLSVLVRADGGASGVKNKQWPGRACRIASGKVGSLIVDCADRFDERLWDHWLKRRRDYESMGWEQDWPFARGRRVPA